MQQAPVFSEPTNAKEFADFVAIASHNFASSPHAMTTYLERFGQENILIATLQHEVVAGLVRIPSAQHFCGATLSMTGLSAVAVRVDRQRRGLARALVDEAIAREVGKGTELVGLFASHHQLYRRLGFSHAGIRCKARVTTSELRFSERRGEIRQITTEDEGMVAELYEKLASRHPGHLRRHGASWQRLLGGSARAATHGLLVCDESGEWVGYVYYRVKRNEGSYHQTLEVLDFVAAQDWVVRRIWTALQDMSSIVAQIQYTTSPVDPFYLAHAHPGQQIYSVEPWMLALANPAKTLLALRYAPATNWRVRISWHADPSTSWMQSGSIALEIANGCAIETTAPVQHHVHCQQAALGGLISGYADPQSLREQELLSADDDQSIANLRALFAGPQPWMREDF